MTNVCHVNRVERRHEVDEAVAVFVEQFPTSLGKGLIFPVTSLPVKPEGHKTH